MLIRGTTGPVLVLLGGLVIVPMPAGNPLIVAKAVGAWRVRAA
ncbi:hypothetical protein [Nocardioides jejuensis]|nr:hypothetical protein [Nocardioides jejuensis]